MAVAANLRRGQPSMSRNAWLAFFNYAQDHRAGSENLSRFDFCFRALGTAVPGLFEIPVRMVATSCLVPAAKLFDRLPNLIGIRRFRDELEICLEFVCGAAVFAVSPIDST